MGFDRFYSMMLGSGWLFSDVDYGFLPWLIIGGLLLSVIISMTLPAHGRIRPNALNEVQIRAV